MKNLLFLGALALLVVACGPAKSGLVKGVIVGKTQLVQDGFTQTLDKTHSKITIAPKQFSIIFPNAIYNPEAKTFYATQIAAFRDKSLLGATKKGVNKNEISYFQAGTGLAGEHGPYTALYLGDYQHHYIYFEEDGGDQRATKVHEMPDGRYMMKWTVENFFEDGADYPLNMIGEDPIYLVFFNDANLNKIVDEGEYHTLELTFE